MTAPTPADPDPERPDPAAADLVGEILRLSFDGDYAASLQFDLIGPLLTLAHCPSPIPDTEATEESNEGDTP